MKTFITSGHPGISSVTTYQQLIALHGSPFEVSKLIFGADLSLE